MLSNSSFNALLKTLEEPPAHVKFLLATTDPQKIPLTVLSRCLQLNLKKLADAQIVEQLAKILTQENISHDTASLKLIARGATGSMRDALSICEQAISFGGGKLEYQAVSKLLGTIGGDKSVALLQAIHHKQTAELFKLTAEMRGHAINYNLLLDDILTLLKRAAVAQALGKAENYGDEDSARITTISNLISPEELQLFYQIALKGKIDFPYVADPLDGLEMILLRMLVFKPSRELPPASPPPQITNPTAEPTPTATPATSPATNTPTNPVTTTAAQEQISATAPAEQTTVVAKNAEFSAQPAEAADDNQQTNTSAQSADLPQQQTEQSEQQLDQPTAQVANESATNNNNNATDETQPTPEKEQSAQGEPLAPSEQPAPLRASPTTTEQPVAEQPVTPQPVAEQTIVEQPAPAQPTGDNTPNSHHHRSPTSAPATNQSTPQTPPATPSSSATSANPAVKKRNKKPQAQQMTDPQRWSDFMHSFASHIPSTVLNCLRNSVVVEIIGSEWYLETSHGCLYLWSESYRQIAEDTLSKFFVQTVNLDIRLGDDSKSPANLSNGAEEKAIQQKKQKKLLGQQQTLESEPKLRELTQKVDANILNIE